MVIRKTLTSFNVSFGVPLVPSLPLLASMRELRERALSSVGRCREPVCLWSREFVVEHEFALRPAPAARRLRRRQVSWQYSWPLQRSRARPANLLPWTFISQIAERTKKKETPRNSLPVLSLQLTRDIPRIFHRINKTSAWNSARTKRRHRRGSITWHCRYCYKRTSVISRRRGFSIFRNLRARRKDLFIGASRYSELFPADDRSWTSPRYRDSEESVHPRTSLLVREQQIGRFSCRNYVRTTMSIKRTTLMLRLNFHE